MHYRLLALDIDGTTLDPDGAITDTARKAVNDALRQDLRVVLCTGRRYRSTLPIARSLGLAGPVVVHNGALVKDTRRGLTLEATYLAAEMQAEIRAALRVHGRPLVYVDGWPEEDVLTEPHGPVHPHQADYLDHYGPHCRFVPDLERSPRRDVVMMSVVGDASAIEALHPHAARALGARVRTHALKNPKSGAHSLEILAPGTGKWPALRRLAEADGIAPHEIAAIGDDRNDVDLVEAAGLGIAMGNAVPELLAVADLVVSANDRDGVAEAIDAVLRAR
jgi:Cof subfamily protein (haloacid dehalogenase superfamily)